MWVADVKTANNKFTRRQASIRAAFINSYPSCITLIELISNNSTTRDVMTALAKGVPHRTVSFKYDVSYSAIYEREVRFYRSAEKFFDLGKPQGKKSAYVIFDDPVPILPVSQPR